MKLRALILSVMLLGLSGLFACTPSQNEQGVVATVNGKKISLKRLEMKYDFKHLDVANDSLPSVEGVRHDYGELLGDLIVEALVHEELEQRGLAVTDEELQTAEDTVRKDYPEGAFEDVLVEEYIDIDAWRQELRGRLELMKLYTEVLRPAVSITYQEAEKYYRGHISEFYLPARVRVHLIEGPSRDAVQSAQLFYLQKKDMGELEKKFSHVKVRELRMQEDRLPVLWRNALKGLDAGEATPVMTGEQNFQSLVFLSKTKARVLDPSRAYPVVEKVLLEQKLRDAFDAWLSKTLERAEIRVSTHLLQSAQKKSASTTKE